MHTHKNALIDHPSHESRETHFGYYSRVEFMVVFLWLRKVHGETIAIVRYSSRAMPVVVLSPAQNLLLKKGDKICVMIMIS